MNERLHTTGQYSRLVVYYPRHSSVLRWNGGYSVRDGLGVGRSTVAADHRYRNDGHSVRFESGRLDLRKDGERRTSKFERMIAALHRSPMTILVGWLLFILLLALATAWLG
jgi:hypothetical protein